MDAQNKICPLKTFASNSSSLCSDKCAWYLRNRYENTDGACAIVYLQFLET
jgi:hypothetical protein